jgi:hypothetical protein
LIFFPNHDVVIHYKSITDVNHKSAFDGEAAFEVEVNGFVIVDVDLKPYGGSFGIGSY